MNKKDKKYVWVGNKKVKANWFNYIEYDNQTIKELETQLRKTRAICEKLLLNETTSFGSLETIREFIQCYDSIKHCEKLLYDDNY